MKGFFSVMLLLCLGNWTVPAQAFELTVLHTNDTHAAYGGSTADGRPCYAAQCEGGSGGSVRLYQAVQAVREQTPGALLLDAGDQFQGTLFFTQHKSAVSARVLDLIGYTAMTPGNHEFDKGCEEFQTFAETLKTPLLAANLRLSASPLQPWLIVTRPDARNGVRRIGIIGLANPNTPTQSSPCAEARFLPPEPVLREAVQELRAQDVDIIIALTHLGLDEDLRLAAAVDGVDIIVGGHSHSLLSNTDKKAVGPYPVVVPSPSGAPVLVVTARYAGQLLGRLNVTFNDVGVATAWNGDPIRLTGTASVSEGDAKVLSESINAFAEPIASLLQEPAGRIIRPEGVEASVLDTPDTLVCRMRECLTGNLVTDAMLWGGKAFGAQAALLVGGSLRTSLPYGEVTTGDLLTTMPYDNLLVCGSMPGRLLLDMLEFSLATYGTGAGRFLQVSGIRYAFDPAQSAGQRLLSASITQSDGTFSPIDPAGIYQIATIDYMTQGGDGYAMLSKVKWEYTGSEQSQVIREYMVTQSPVSVAFEKRIEIR